MRTSPSLGRVSGIRLRLHYTWFVAIVLITAAVTTQFSMAYPILHRIVLGITASLIFFMVIVIREFVISFVAIRKGISIKSITLFLFGGVYQIDKEANRPAIELLLAAVGMLFNLIIAGVFYIIYFVMLHTGNIMVDVLMQWLAFICFMLALFHFVPGFPLDGGRVLRAVLWKATNNYQRVTRITSWTGWGIGIIFTIGGIVVVIFTQQWFAGALLAFPGLVLQNAATHSRRQANDRAA